MNFFSFALVFALSGCALLRPSVHNQMAKDLRSYTYPYPVAELRAHLVEAMPKLYSIGGPTLIFDRDRDLPIVSPSRSMQVATELDRGFTYKGKFFQAPEFAVDLSDFQRADLAEHWRAKLTELFRNSDFHLLENTDRYFLLVKGGDVYEAFPAGPGRSRLRVREFSSLRRGPIRLALDPSGVLKKGWRWWHSLRLEQDPVTLEGSLEYAVENPAAALRVFYLLRPEEAAEWEARRP